VNLNAMKDVPNASEFENTAPHHEIVNTQKGKSSKLHLLVHMFARRNTLVNHTDQNSKVDLAPITCVARHSNRATPELQEPCTSPEYPNRTRCAFSLADHIELALVTTPTLVTLASHMGVVAAWEDRRPEGLYGYACVGNTGRG